MRCEQCGKADAVVRITRIESGAAPYQLCLCQSCAAKASPHQKKLLEKQSTYDVLLQKLMKHQAVGEFEAGGSVAEVAEEESPLTCPSCGLNFGDYQRTLMLGCPDCYESFSDVLEKDLTRFHRATRHTGSEEHKPSELANLQDRLRDARSELKSALEIEDYERAAFLRDEISNIESRMEELRTGEA